MTGGVREGGDEVTTALLEFTNGLDRLAVKTDPGFNDCALNQSDKTIDCLSDILGGSGCQRRLDFLFDRGRNGYPTPLACNDPQGRGHRRSLCAGVPGRCLRPLA